jgi:glycosyltransferase involved in cell wall biosynthesis
LASGVKEEDEEDFSTLEESAKGYPIEFLINSTKDELWSMYNRARIYWHASGYGEDLYRHPELAEHFGISTVEAMGVGVVPVVINAGGQKEIVEDGENGFLWNTLDELEEKTLLLTKDTVRWEKMSQACREKAKQFSKERFCHEVNLLLGDRV